MTAAGYATPQQQPSVIFYLCCCTQSNSVVLCFSWTAVLLVDTGCSEPECQQHGSTRAVSTHWFVTSARSFLPAVTPLTTTPGNPLAARITQIFPSTGWQGICFTCDFLSFLLNVLHHFVRFSKLFWSSRCHWFQV